MDVQRRKSKILTELFLMFLLSGIFLAEKAGAANFVPPETRIEKPYGDEACLAGCHGKENFGAEFNSAEDRCLTLPVQYEASTHPVEGVSCVDCHVDADPNFHPEGGFEKVDCKECHGGYGETSGIGGALASFRLAAHGKGDLSINFERSECPSCHYAALLHGQEENKPCPKCHDREGSNRLGLTVFHINDQDSNQPWSRATRWIYEGIFWSALISIAAIKIKKTFLK